LVVLMMREQNYISARRRRSGREGFVPCPASFGLDAFSRASGHVDSPRDQRHTTLCAHVRAKTNPRIGVRRQTVMDVYCDDAERARGRMSERRIEKRYGIATAGQRDGNLGSVWHMQRKRAADRGGYERGRLHARRGRIVVPPLAVSSEASP
jgi:hypothetical protein